MEKIISGPINGKYHEEVRSFSIAFAFISMSAYNFVRLHFDDKLPCLSSLKNWLRINNGNPGITSQLLQKLEEKIRDSKNNGKELRWTLSFDEMDIKSAIEYDVVKEEACGYVDFGDGNDTDRSMAKQVLVFYLHCINER